MKKFKSWLRRKMLWLMIVLMVLALIALALAPSVVRIVGSGQAGVLYRTLGDGTETEYLSTYGEGLHLILPWDELYIYDVRIHEESSVIHVLTKDGLSVDVEISVRFHPNITTLGLLHKYVGPDYVAKVIQPEIEATARDVIGTQDLDSLYSDQRVAIQNKISARALKAINKQTAINNYETLKGDQKWKDFDHNRTEEYIIFEHLFIKDIRLPLAVEEKIEQKIVAEQELLRYEYLIASEEKEKQRKLIEAEGIRTFEDSSRISILKWRGLQATEKLAESPNSKVIVIGTDENLPIILNGETPN